MQWYNRRVKFGLKIPNLWEKCQKTSRGIFFWLKLFILVCMFVVLFYFCYRSFFSMNKVDYLKIWRAESWNPGYRGVAGGRWCDTVYALQWAAPRLLRYWTDIYGQLNEPPLSSMSRIRVSMGVLPTSRTKNSCSMTWAEMVRSDGNLSNSLPKRVGCPGYCVRTYSSSAHWDFSWIDSTWAMSDMPQASVTHGHAKVHDNHYYKS